MPAMRRDTGKPASGPAGEPESCTRVLVVEDSEEFSASVRELLASSGYKVLPTISSGEDAVRVAGSSRPDIVLIDVGLGGIVDGIESGGRIAEEIGIPVIFLSGYTDDKALERAKMKKPSGYLVKPFNKADLQSSIEIALSRRRAYGGEDSSMTSAWRGEHAGAFTELKEMRDEIIRLKMEICEYREIIDSLNKSLSELRGPEGFGNIGSEKSITADIEPRVELEFESE